MYGLLFCDVGLKIFSLSAPKYWAVFESQYYLEYCNQRIKQTLAMYQGSLASFEKKL